jgi:hypothetical protein
MQGICTMTLLTYNQIWTPYVFDALKMSCLSILFKLEHLPFAGNLTLLSLNTNLEAVTLIVLTVLNEPKFYFSCIVNCIFSQSIQLLGLVHNITF